MKRILVATHRAHPTLGGIERYVYKVSNRISENNSDINILNLAFSKDSYENSYLENFTIKSIKSFFIMGDTLPLPFFSAITYYRTIKQYKPAVIHTHGRYFVSTYIAKLYSRLNKIPHIHTEHIEGEIMFANKIIHKIVNIIDKILFNLILKPKTQFIAISKATQSFFKSHFKVDSKVIYSCVDISELEGYLSSYEVDPRLAKGKIKILFMYRLVDSKGYKEFIKLAESTSGKYQFIMAGSGPGEEFTKAASERLDNLIYLGRLEHSKAVQTMANVDLLINLSEQEGFSVSLQEATYLNKPIVATDIPSNRESLESVPTAKLISSRDPKNVLNEIELLLGNPIQFNGKKSIEDRNLTLNKIAEIYAKLYMEVKR